ncbi:MAG TPA: hypothetical protein VEW25_08435 [Allosphingosinicella sp.]|nr:hypothetical protein [Allosphingosinicella sp.]
MSDPQEPSGPSQQKLAMVAAIVTVAASVFSIIQGVRSPGLAVLIFGACAVVWLALSGHGRKTVAVGRFRLSLNVLSAVLLLAMVAVVLLTTPLRQQRVGFEHFPVDRNAPQPRLVQSAAACVTDLKQRYSCHDFRELVARSRSTAMSDDPRELTLDDPLELAVSVGQRRMLTEGGTGDYCGLYESSISEACHALAGAETQGSR